uniref:lipocalin family protein n=1 Tax=Bordetella sputigena TaxID=1416810 RepID=UPI0039EE5015
MGAALTARAADAGAAADSAADNAARPTPVPSVDLRSYLGKWYEIARLPRFYQRYCVGDSIATYSIRDPHTIAIENSCRTKDGDIRTAHGTAEPVPGSNNAKLEVTFLPPFTGDYWIIGLAPDYTWSVVGSPGRKALWILSRTPRLPAAALDKARSIARAAGYAVDELVYTPQSDAHTAGQ